MRDAENESHEGKRKSESLWPIMRISHARSRYIYELYYKREAISKELYDWLLKEKYADAKQVQVRIVSTGSYSDYSHVCSLIAKWKKTGYEKLCCLRCIQTKASVNDPASCVFILTDPLGHELSRFDMHLSRSQSTSACWNCRGMCPLWYVIPPVALRQLDKPRGWQAVVVAVLTHEVTISCPSREALIFLALLNVMTCSRNDCGGSAVYATAGDQSSLRYYFWSGDCTT
jgi:hypothetical protein